MTMQVIQHIELGSAQANITFSSIPNTFTDLLLVTSVRTTGSGGNPSLLITLNSSTANFSGRYLQGNGGSAYSGTIERWIGTVCDSSFTANTFSSHSVYFPNYASSTSKSFSADAVSENNGSTSYQDLGAGLWANNAAISSIVVVPATNNLATGSSATLYGITRGSDGITTVS